MNPQRRRFLFLLAASPVAALATPRHAALAASRATADDGGPSTGLPPNKLGRILILEYHSIGHPEGTYQRTPDNFRADLQTLYDAGFRTVSLQSVLDGRIDIPAGTSPVVLTFDDSWASQLTLDRNGQPVPWCAVGILEDFAATHPGFGTHAVFYVVWTQLFGRQGTYAVQWLVDHGYEIGDHTLHHPNLSRLSNAAVQSEIGDEVVNIAATVHGPDGGPYMMQTMALPYGNWPQRRELAAHGYASNGTPYDFAAVIAAWGGPAPTPARADFSSMGVPRTLAGAARLQQAIATFQARPDTWYISDGNANTLTYPGYLAPLLAPDAGLRWQLQPY